MAIHSLVEEKANPDELIMFFEEELSNKQ